MKTKALLLAAILFATGSTVCFAANDSANSDNTTKKECKKGDNCDRKRPDFNPFEGLNLTENQQSKLNDLKSECCKRKESGQKGDKQKPDRREAKREYLAKVKSILTPEQYVTFLENMTLNRPDMGPAHNRNMKKANMGKKDMKGNRPDKGQMKKQKDSSK